MEFAHAPNLSLLVVASTSSLPLKQVVLFLGSQTEISHVNGSLLFRHSLREFVFVYKGPTFIQDHLLMIYGQSMAVEARGSLNKQLSIAVVANFFTQCHHVNDNC